MVLAVGWLTSAAFVQGPEATTAYMVGHYTTALARVGPHMALGGLALGLGVLQLVPALRRRRPRWHRASGLVVWLATGYGARLHGWSLRPLPKVRATRT